MVLGSLYDSLSVEQRKVITEPNLIDFQTMRNTLANLLYAVRSEEEEMGHSSVVETTVGHQRRVNDPVAVIQTPPVKPTKMATTESRQIWFIYRWDLDIFNKYVHWNHKVIKVTKLIFPNGLTDLEIDTSGVLPMSLTGRQAFDHIESKTKTDIIATEAYCKILKRMMQRK